MILIAYDGSASAAHAITVAASLLGRRKACVVHVWEPPADTRDALPLAAVVGHEVEEEVNRESAEARAVAETGIAQAREAGFDADGEAVRHPGGAAHALEDVIERLAPELVVIGSRGLDGLKAALNGSVSRHVGAHAHVPVLIVPPASGE